MEGAWKWGAVEREAAATEGVKVPVRRTPRAWTVGVVSCGVCGEMGGGPGRKPGCGPAMVRSSETRSPLSLFISGEEERGIVGAGLWV